MSFREKRILRNALIVVMILAGIFGTAGSIKDGKRSMNEQSTEYILESDVSIDAAVAQDISNNSLTTEEISSLIDGMGSLPEVDEDAAIKKDIDQMIYSMSTKEKVGQVFFIKNDGRFGADILEKYPVGGIILFAGDMRGQTPASLTEKIEGFQNASKYPLLMGTDEEGGSVIRVSNVSALSSKKFRSPRDIFASGGFDAIKADTEEKSDLLLSYGINVNFAPVCDVSVHSGEFMYKRSFGDSAEDTAEYVDLVVSVMKEKKMGSVLKHFPGYGNNSDTHKAIVHDKREYEQFETEDYLPFIAGINQGADCVLVSHNIVECMDPDYPASLSQKVHEELRDKLGFEGVIITDDLMMGGVSNGYSKEEAAVQAFLAGNDMLLSTDYAIQFDAVLKAVENGEISEERLDESVRRVLLWKHHLGLELKK